MTLANKITIIRIIFIPVFVITLLHKEPAWPLYIFIALMLTDIIDGIVARGLKQRTELGGFLDPLADKLLMTSAYLTLVTIKAIHKWIFVVVFSRDLILVLGWVIIFIFTGRSSIVPRLSGKITTFIQMLTVLVILLGSTGGIYELCLWSMISITVISAFDYLLSGSKQLRQFG